MLGDAPLMLREFVMKEPLPLATIHRAVFEFLQGRTDCAVFGAYSVNAYAARTRATQDVDIESTHAEYLAEELKRYLNERFYIATRVRSVRGGIGFRIYQVSKPENRHLVDVRPVPNLPPLQVVDGIQVVTPTVAIANKIISYASRREKDKGLSDALDLRALLRAFPDLQAEYGPVRERLEASGADKAVLAVWREWVTADLEPEDEDDEFER